MDGTLTEKERRFLERDFTKKQIDQLVKTSPSDNHYNCLAYAMSDTSNWWWPFEGYWPEGVPKQETVEAVMQAFATRGFRECADGQFEPGFVKVAIYENRGECTHAARQMGPDYWTSKLGYNVDVLHKLGILEGNFYGKVVRFMKRA